MREYLEREALVAATENVPFKTAHGLTKEQCDGANFARLTLAAIFKALPAADVVKVVRCAECVHSKLDTWYEEKDDPYCYWCSERDDYFKADEYCSSGVSRRGGGNR